MNDGLDGVISHVSAIYANYRQYGLFFDEAVERVELVTLARFNEIITATRDALLKSAIISHHMNNNRTTGAKKQLNV
jgi:hypothetical protein